MPDRFSLQLNEAPTAHYALVRAEREEVLPLGQDRIEDVSSFRSQRKHSHLTLGAEIARYLNLEGLDVAAILDRSTDGIAAILTRVNEFNELLYDWVIPRLFAVLYTIEQVPNEIALV